MYKISNLVETACSRSDEIWPSCLLIGKVIAVVFLLRIAATVFYYAEDQEMSHKAQVF